MGDMDHGEESAYFWERNRKCPHCRQEVAADGTCINAECPLYNSHVRPPLREEEE